MEHAWNVVSNQGELKHIDIAYAIMNRNKVDKSNYFLKTFDELKQLCGNRSINESLDDLKKALCGKIRIISRTDQQPENKIKIISRTDQQPENKIKIISRNDENRIANTRDSKINIIDRSDIQPKKSSRSK